MDLRFLQSCRKFEIKYFFDLVKTGKEAPLGVQEAPWGVKEAPWGLKEAPWWVKEERQNWSAPRAWWPVACGRLDQAGQQRTTGQDSFRCQKSEVLKNNENRWKFSWVYIYYFDKIKWEVLDHIYFLYLNLLESLLLPNCLTYQNMTGTKLSQIVLVILLAASI